MGGSSAFPRHGTLRLPAETAGVGLSLPPGVASGEPRWSSQRPRRPRMCQAGNPPATGLGLASEGPPWKWSVERAMQPFPPPGLCRLIIPRVRSCFNDSPPPPPFPWETAGTASPCPSGAMHVSLNPRASCCLLGTLRADPAPWCKSEITPLKAEAVS